jgi:hypothetical protein
MDYLQFTQQYPIANALLINLAASRIAQTPEFIERETRARIAQLNKQIDQALWSVVPDTTLEYRRNNLEDYCRRHCPDYQMLEQEKLTLLSQLSGAKKSQIIQPTTSQIIAATQEVKDYLTQLLFKGSTEALLKWNNVLSNQEKYILSRPYGFALTEAKGINNWWYCDQDMYTPSWEPLIETIKLGDNAIGYITENSYGVKCLNSPNVMFVDVDSDADADEVPCSALPFGKLNWNTSMSLQVINQFCFDNPELSFAVYRTRNGLRLIELSNQWKADSTEAMGVLNSLGSDPLFTALCDRQGTFRARLEVKPWRTGSTVCQSLGTVGHGRPNETALAVQRVHDSWCLGDGELA